MATMRTVVAGCKCSTKRLIHPLLYALTRMEAVDHGAGPVVGHAYHALQQRNQTHPIFRPSRVEQTKGRREHSLTGRSPACAMSELPTPIGGCKPLASLSAETRNGRSGSSSTATVCSASAAVGEWEGGEVGGWLRAGGCVPADGDPNLHGQRQNVNHRPPSRPQVGRLGRVRLQRG